MVLWRAYVASFVLNLPHTNALIRWLSEDAELRAICGFGDQLPHRTTFNRFIQRLSHNSDLVAACFIQVTGKLKKLLPDLGQDLAIDSTTVRSHSNPNRKRISDPEASWTAKNSAGAKEGGKEWFFGMKLHMVADANSRFVLDTERYKVKLYGLAEELDEAHELLQASGYQIDNARTETRWSWLPLQSVHSSAPVAYAVSALPSDIHALMLHCYEGKTWLWLWPYGYDLHGGENYSVFAGFGDAPLIHQVTEPYNPGPAVGLLDVEGGTFWHKDTFSVQGAYGGVTVFDTTQLKRMFPTEGA